MYKFVFNLIIYVCTIVFEIIKKLMSADNQINNQIFNNKSIEVEYLNY